MLGCKPSRCSFSLAFFVESAPCPVRFLERRGLAEPIGEWAPLHFHCSFHNSPGERKVGDVGEGKVSKGKKEKHTASRVSAVVIPTETKDFSLSYP